MRLPIPTMAQVEAADREQLCRWHRFLSTPETDEGIKIINRIYDRWSEAGGFTPELSKKIGWDE